MKAWQLILGFCAALVAGIAWPVVIAGAKAPPKPCTLCESGIDGAFTDSTGVGYVWMESARAYFSVPADGFEEQGEGEARKRYVIRYVTNCENSSLESGADTLCARAICEVDGKPGVEMWVYRKEEGQPDDAFVMAPTPLCMGAGSVVTLAQIEAAVGAQIEAFYERLGQPGIELDPDGMALVNLPVIASTTEYQRQEFDIDNPLPGRIVAQPYYNWTWSNGDTGTGPGIPYTPAVSPLQDPDFYDVHTVYQRTGDGRVSLDLEWAATVHVGANPPQRLTPVRFSATEEFPVRQARTELVAD